MKKTAKILSILLAIIMAVTVLPFAAFAEEAPVEVSDARLGVWKDNYQFLIDTVLNDTNYTSYKYVDINKKAMKNEMDAYTAFALYDNAWKNYATHEINIDNAKEILLALIEKANYEINDGYMDEFIKVLEKAEDFNELIQKVNKYLKNDVIASEEWGTAFKVINAAVKIGHAYQDIKADLIKAYARVLSVRQSSSTYIEFLTYIAENATDVNLKAAAQDLVASMNNSLKDELKRVAENTALDYLAFAGKTGIEIAANTNVYTAAILKIYGTAKKITDVLWNTGDKFVALDALMCSYEFQALTSDWTEAKLAGEDADAAVYAFGIAVAARELSEEALFNLKKADSDGVVGKIKNKLYGTVYKDTEVSQASLSLIKDIMFAKDLANAKKVVNGLKVFCPVDLTVTTKANAKLYTLADKTELSEINGIGAFASVYSEYSKDYLKVAFLFEDYRVKLTGTAEGYVTLIMDVLQADGTINDWSFTDVKVAQGDTVVFDTTAVEAPFFTFAKKDGGIEKLYFNDEFVESEQKEVTVKDVIDATVEVGKEEAKTFAEKIKAFFKNLFANLFKIFKKKK